MAAWDSFWTWRRCLEIPAANEATLSRSEFEQISELAHSSCGIDLRKDKQALVEARLGKEKCCAEFYSAAFWQ